MASGLSNIGKKLKTTDPKEDQKEEYSSGLAKIGYRFKEKNQGGLAGGTAYTLGRVGVGLMAPIEGVTDVLAATGDLIMLNPQKAKQRFTNSYTGEWRESLDEWYNPGKGMQVVGDITGGVGQSVAYGLISMIPYAGVPLMYTSIGSQGVSSAAQKTGNLGWRELGYGVTVGAVEGLLESKLGAGVKGAKTLGSAILKKTGKNVVKSSAKTAGKGMAKTVLTDVGKSFAGEFAEEAISEWADPLAQRTWGIDKEARADFGSILYAGVIGGVSGGIVAAGPSAINYRSAVNTGRAIQEKGLDGELINRARRTLAGFEITKERAEAMKVEKPSGDEKETAEQKKARNKANKESKKISKQTAELADKIEKNIKAYEELRADPAKADKDMTAAVLGELRGNLFLLPIAYQVDTVEAVLREASDADRQAFVDVINEQMQADGKEGNYTLADFDADKDQIRRRLAGELELEELYERMGMQTSEEATETAKEVAGEAQDLWAGIAEDADFEALGATSEAERALMQAARIQGVPNASVGEMLNQFRKGTALTPAEFAEGWADGTQTYGRFGFDTKDADGTAFGRMETEAREAAMKYGRESAEAETKAREEAAKAKKKPAEQAGKKGEVVRGEGLNIQKLSDEQYSAYKASEVLAEVLGTDIVLETNIELNGKTVNGYYSRKTNRLHININAMRNGKNIAVYTLGHEVTHYIKEWSPAKFKVLQDFVMKQMGVDAETAIAEKMASLKRLGIITDTMTVAEANDIAAEEVVADGMELILTDGKVLAELSKTDKSLWEKIRDWFFDIIGQIRRSWESLNQASKTAQVLKETVESLDEIERLFTEGVKEAGERTRKAGVETNAVREETEVRYSSKNEYDSEKAGIADQIRNSQEKLNQMDPVYVATVPENVGNKEQGGTWAISELKKYGFRADRQNFGTIFFDEKSIRDAMNYLDTNEEKASIIAIFRVLKQGIIVGEHGDHKNRSKHTITFGAPVVLNGIRGNMAVVVNMRNNKYYVHRILLPDGSTFKFDIKQKDAKQESQRGVPEGSLANATSSASNSSIPQPKDSVNSKLSISEENSSDTAYLAAVERGDMETAQRMVDEAAKAAGYLNLFYHGAKKGGGFTVFRDWSYFTENKAYAERYTDREKPSSLYRTYVKLEKAFDTRKAKDRRIFAQIRDEYGLGEIQDTGLPDWTDGYDISDYIDENDLDYDGIILDEGGDLVNGEPVSRGLSYVVRKSAQIKSADPVTYDDAGNVIPLSERFKEDKSDIRYSIDETTENADASGNEAERLFTEGAKEAGERTRTAGVETRADTTGKKFSAETIDNDNVISPDTYSDGSKYPSDVYAESLKDQFDDWMQGIMPYNGYFDFGMTPPVLVRNNAPKIPLIMLEDVVYKFTTDYGHEIAVDDVAKLPTEFKDPVFLFKGSRENSMVVVTDILDKSGDPVIVAIHLNKLQKRARVNRVASLYGKHNIENYVKSRIEAGDLIDASAEKAPAWFTNRGLQLPKLVQTITDAYKHSIAQPDNFVNSKLSISEEISEENSSDNLYSIDETPETADVSGNETDTAYLAAEDQNLLLDAEMSALKNHFGTTKNFELAGYILPDGYMLDFSGKHWGDTNSDYRQVDHRDVNEVFENQSGNEAMVHVIGGGGIRLNPESGGINLSLLPSDAQRRTLRGYINHFNGEVVVDFDNADGRTIESIEYNRGTSASRILTDIEKYILQGVKPREQSELQRFRYSMDETAENADVSENERLKAENKKLEERVQRMRYRQFRKAVESGEMEAKAHKQELSDGATTVLESIGIGDGRNHTELTRRMSELYARMAGEKKISYGEAFDEAAKISDWLLGIQHDIRDVEASERAREILKTVRGTKIRLTFTQKGEVANLMGNSDAYRKAMLGKVTVTNNDGVPLDVQWAEWSDLYPDVFSKEVDEADMPDRLRRIYDMLTMQRDRTESVDQYINRDELTNTIFTQVGQIGWNEIQTEEARPDLSDRDMLLAIAEQMVGSENEYKIISDYKKKYDGIRRKEKRIQELNDRQQELQSILFTSENAKARSDASKELRAIYEETSGLLEEVAEADKKLANIEGMKVIRNLIKVERMEARETSRAEYKKMQKESSERKEITIRKRQVQRILNNLNTMLYHPTKAKHVPPLMQSLVDYALKRADPKQFGINRDNIRTMSELAADIEKMKRKVALTADEQEQLYEMESNYKKLEAETLSVKWQAEALMTAFETWVEQTSDAEVVDENMLQGLRDTVKEIDEAPLHLMTLKSLEAVESLYAAIKYQVDHSNNLFATNEKLGKQEMGQEATAEVAKQKESKLFTPKPGEWTKIARVREFIWENLKPLTAFEVIGSDKLMSLFRNILNGEDVWVTDVLEGKKVLDEAKKKYGYNKWDLTARKEVTTADGSTVSLTLGERMSLYAYMFREQAEEHLSTGGFKLAPDAKVVRTLKNVKAFEGFLNDQTAYQMRKEDIAKMAEGLTQDQKDYARAVQKYLTSLGKKGNEVSLKLYGVEIFNETDYFPIKSDRDYLKAQAGKTGDPQIKNRGTFKETTPGANNPIVLEDFMQVTSEHINTMAVYHAFTLPMEDLLRVWNYKPVNYKTDENGNVLLNDKGLPIADNEKAVQYNSLKAEITKKYGKKANDYILQLMRDLNGGARQDSATTILDKGLTAFKRSATMLSLSTIIQQPTSIFRAMAYIPAKYFKGAKFYDYETVKKYAPVAAIKQIGGHDTSTGARTVEYINSKEYENQKEKLAAAAKRKVAGGDPQARADYFGFLTEKADEFAWRYLFGACVNEQAAKLKKPASSEEVLKAAGERFADVVRRTQVYDSTLTRSEIMRSKSSAAKLVTAFGAEPATVVSMLVDGIVKAERGDKSFFRKTAGAVAVSIIINAMASSLIYAVRDDDEDENFLEKYVQALTGEIIEGFTLFEYLPYARDVMSLFKGYDVERSDMTLIGNLFDQVEMITSSKRSFADKLFGVSGAVSAFFGVPITNVYRDAKGIIKTAASFGDAEPVTGGGTGGAVVSGLKSQYNLIFKLFGAQEGNAYELYKAALRGDTAHYERVASRYETEKDAEMALRKELRENDKRIAEAAQAKVDGELEVFESIIEQIEGEGHFDRNLIIRAVNNEVLSIQDASKQATATKDDTVTDEEDEEIAEALYTYTDLADAIDREDADDFKAVYDYLLSFKMEQGKTEAQAKASIKSSVTSKYKKLYLEAWAKNNTVEMRRLLELLIKTGLYGNRNDTAKTVEKWVRDANK